MPEPDQGRQAPVLNALSEECRSMSETLGVIQPDDWTRDDSRFILAATGRIPLDDPRFPVMG